MGEELSSITMYQACLLHSRAERVLKNIVSKHLKEYDLTRMEWIMLATLALNKRGVGYSMSELSDILDIKLSQLTILVAQTTSLGLAKQVTLPNDRRTKLVTITKVGNDKIDKIEKSMRQAMREWLEDIPRDKLKTYLATLKLLGEVGN